MQPLLDAAAGFKDVPKVREIIGERRARLDRWRASYLDGVKARLLAVAGRLN